MAGAPSHPILRLVRRIAGSHGPGANPDALLLERFVSAADESAFQAIVHRHGPLVLSVCTRVLDNEHDAEDAFQATFLVLARKAGSVRAPELLGPWLYGVAYRTALKAKAESLKRRKLERRLPDMPSPPDTDNLIWRDLRPVLDEEVSRLPQKYRVPFVLCYLEGKTNEQAARILGCPPGTIYSRLAWARERLRSRLGRRGLAFSVAALVVCLSRNAVSAAVSAPVVVVTSKAALAFAAGQAAAAGAVPGQAAALAEGVLRAMFLTKLKIALVATLAVAVAGSVAGILTHQALAREEQGDKKGGVAADKPKADKDNLQGTWVPVSAEEGGKKITDDEIKAAGFEMVFDGDKVTFPIKGEPKELGYKLDPAKKPKQIDLVFGEGKTAKGIYLLDGDTLKMCVQKDPDGERPAEFVSKEGTEHWLIVLERKK
jgi:RNA polymerase sigma factor (sigma-70 family)